MAKRKWNSATERQGVNFVRCAIEANNSVFKEIDVRHDYGHDAFVLFVNGENVTSKEVALQIKSGKSYCRKYTCRIPATRQHLEFWRSHDLITLGVVYDPAENTAYWIDLKEEARYLIRQHRAQSNFVIEFPKSPWNMLNEEMFRRVLLQTIQGKAPDLSLKTAVEWSNSDDYDTHCIGIRVMTARYWRVLEAWETMVSLFHNRPPANVTPNLAIGFSRVLGHPDDCSMMDAPSEVKNLVTNEVLSFGPIEIAKVLSYVGESGFGRPSSGYSLLPVLAARESCRDIFAKIRDDGKNDEEIRENAAILLMIAEEDPGFILWCHKGA
ncbi:MAG TPA: DUF4365 domain-containing protein [Azospirillaceae bacterium]|nr:DUF4365 domain-containing protein [Azospirillaceae bacterium]